MYHYCQYHQLQLLLHLHHDLILELHIRVIDSNSCHLIVGRKQFDIEMNFLLLGHHRPSLINQEFHFYLCHIYQYLLHRKKIRVHKNEYFTEIALTQAKRKDPISKGDTPISRSIIQTANAYLYNNTVCVDFNEVLPNVTITLINESTSKLIHSEAYNEPTNIDITLDEGYSSGNYLIKIESDEVLLYGYFSL